MITPHDEAQIQTAIQKRCTTANQQRETIARLEAEKAALSAHLESVATERDRLMQRVMELERKLAQKVGNG